MSRKTCTSCNKKKDINDFYKNIHTKNGLVSCCKLCLNIKNKKYREANKKKIKERRAKYYKKNKDRLKKCSKIYKDKNKDKTIEYLKKNEERIKERRVKYYKKNKEKIKKCSKNYSKQNEEKIKKYYKKNKDKTKEYLKKNKDKISKRYAKYKKNRKISDPLFKFTDILRSRTYKAFKIKNWKKTSKTSEMLGCNPETAFSHIESQFIEGMSWENHGLYGWHIDHIVPLSSAKNEEELMKLCHYTNLQPLWAKDNLRKGDKIL